MAPRPTATETKASILPLFPLLSSHDTPTRLDASLSLLTALPLVASTPTATTSADDADTPYAIQRLVNGLGSSNEASRQGFAVALTELLARLPIEKATAVLPLILTASTPNAGSDSKEERDLLFARLLGLHAVIRSGILFNFEQSNGEAFKEVILALLALSGKKSWIREPAFWVLVEGVRSLFELKGKKVVPEWREEMGKWLVQRLLVDSREKARGFGPEKISLVLVLQTYGVEADYVSVLSPTFPSGNVLSRASLVALSSALKGSTLDSDSTESANAAGGKSGPKMGSNAVKTSKGGTAPAPGAAPHFVWNQIFDLYFPPEGHVSRKGEERISEGKAQWGDVWRVLVDQSLFGPPSLPLKATGFALLSMAIQRLPPADVPALFGNGVMRTLTNHLRKSNDGEKTLTRVAEKVVASLPPFVVSYPTVSLPLLKALVSPPHSSHAFDPKTIERIVSKLDLKSVKGWVKYLRDLILGEEVVVEDEKAPIEQEDEKLVVAKRLWAFDQLLHVVKSGAVVKDDEILAGLLEFFAVLGWFEVRKSGKGARSYVPTPPFTSALQIASRSRFFSVLTSLPTTPSPSGQTWLFRALALLDNLTADSKHFTAVAETDDEVVEARKELKEIYEKLGNKDDERMKTAKGLVEGVLLLSYDEGEEASEAVEQLQDCLPALFPTILEPAPKREKDDDSEDEDDDMEGAEAEEDPEPTTVLVDLLLELLHRPSAFVKGVAQSVFTGFADEMGEQAMELLLEQIRPEEPEEVPEDANGDVPMAASDDDDDEVEEDDSAAESKSKKRSSKGSATAEKKKKSREDYPEMEPDSDDNDEDSDDSDDEEIDEAFRNELLAALQASVAEEFDAQEENEDDDEEDLLDDEQMMALDDKLADIFKLQGGAGSKGKKVDRTDDVHYRLRVIDLVESLAKQRSTSPHLVLVVLPLFSIVRSSNSIVEQELQSKASKLLRQIVGARKDAPSPADPQSALDALTELLTLSQQVDMVELASLCSQSCVYLAKAALASPAANKQTTAAVVKVYGDAFASYLSKKNSKTKVQPASTIEFCRRLPGCAWPLFERIAKLVGEGGVVNAFRRMQAFEVTQALLTSFAGLKTDESKTAIIASMPLYRNTIHTLLTASFQSTTSNPSPTLSLDLSRLKDLLKVTLASVRLTASSSSASTASQLWKSESFASLVKECLQSEKFKNAVAVKNLLKQVVSLIGGPAATAQGGNGKGEGTKKRKGLEEENGGKGKKAEKKARKESKKDAGAKGKAKQEVEPEVGEMEVEENEDEDDEEVQAGLVEKVKEVVPVLVKGTKKGKKGKK